MGIPTRRNALQSDSIRIYPWPTRKKECRRRKRKKPGFLTLARASMSLELRTSSPPSMIPSWCGTFPCRFIVGAGLRQTLKYLSPYWLNLIPSRLRSHNSACHRSFREGDDRTRDRRNEGEG